MLMNCKDSLNRVCLRCVWGMFGVCLGYVWGVSSVVHAGRTIPWVAMGGPSLGNGEGSTLHRKMNVRDIAG